MLSRWNVGRGAKSSQTAKHVFFMTLASLKHCGDWATVAGNFHIQPPTFEKMVLGFLDILSPLINGMYVEDLAKAESMEKLTLSGSAFARYPCAHYATGVTFQQANMPSGREAQRKWYYSKKHKLHGYKVDVSVIPTGFAINSTRHYLENAADIDICRENIDFHRQHLKKLPSEERLADDGPLHDNYPNDWAVLCDKGYQGLETVLRAIHPTKKPRGRSLTLAQVNENHDISRDRIVVGNFLGRMYTLWALCSDKFRWNEDNDGAAFRAHRKRLIETGEPLSVGRTQYWGRRPSECRLRLHPEGLSSGFLQWVLPPEEIGGRRTSSRFTVPGSTAIILQSFVNEALAQFATFCGVFKDNIYTKHVQALIERAMIKAP
ncbi:hypothetical protein PF010_g9788 [Phytophthora fragariae]|uniref:DDE Tnp4 domain-containing protein n=2 Tax=Phytophthora fragariae TaxID=53985 RepID=A0A6A3L6S4_9STRA|nr:hypothetical protein PF011_g9249 [Phytophthora fragariae]KAE9114218.1 hypothetical protein PF010_g9788 [Phytophthora fragariae]KAE9232389.1 hypothetical protein PF004_g9927 [Phytophthora fragariae]